jgi:hypothetical protein
MAEASALTGAIPAEASAAVKRSHGYIVGAAYDSIFFITAPLSAFALGILISISTLPSMKVTILGHEGSPDTIFIGSFIMAHLFIVFFRSNGNRKIYELYPYRFTVVPLVLFSAMCLSKWVAVSASVLATWWDVYHSSLQTFGLGRIYDSRAGNDANVGRRLDLLLNLLIYAGPILAGAVLMLHTRDFEQYQVVRSLLFAHLGDAIDAKQTYLRIAVLTVGVPFIAYYLYAYWRYHQRGYTISPQKVALLASTAAVSIYTWGFNSFGQAFFIMNFFHAFQYFGIVWWSEKKSMMGLFRLDQVKWGKWATLALFLTIGCGYGIWAEICDGGGITASGLDLGWNVAIVVSLMHFWYDGFIWSVRRNQV